MERQSMWVSLARAASTAVLLLVAVRPLTAQAPTGATTLDMVLVEGGTFQMGDTFGDGGPGERPVHPVTVSSFLIARTEVTVGDFRGFVQETGYKTTAEREGRSPVWTERGMLEWKRGVSWRSPYFDQGDGQPVVLVSWFDAAEYCNWLSRKEGFSPFYTVSGTSVSMNWGANGYRLPTEAEWEYAARGGKQNRGTKYAGSASPDRVAWSSSNSGGMTQPVGTKAANELGLHDMSGNVWEWCNDHWYGSYAEAAQTDPRGPEYSSGRALRGGSWGNGAINVRVAVRYGAGPGDRVNDTGFRPVRRPA